MAQKRLDRIARESPELLAEIQARTKRIEAGEIKPQIYGLKSDAGGKAVDGLIGTSIHDHGGPVQAGEGSCYSGLGRFGGLFRRRS